MITGIKIYNYKSFHPSIPVEISLNADGKPVLIYGLNGAGKSTIGEVIHYWSRGDSSVAHCRVETVGHGPFRVLVYNQEFVSRVVGSVAGMPGIFTLGEFDTDTQKEIEARTAEAESLEVRCEQLVQLIDATTRSISGLEASALAEIWKAHTSHVRGELGHLLSGYGNSRKKFFDDLRRVSVLDDELLDSEEQLVQRWADAISTESEKSIIAVDMSAFIDIERDSVWADPIAVSGESRLAGLIEQWGNSDWVGQGRAHVHGEQCPFCQEPLPADFWSELTKLLDGDRQKSIDHISAQAVKYEQQVDSIKTAVKRIISEPFAQQEPSLSVAWATLQSHLDANVQAMKAKINAPGKNAQVSTTEAELKAFHAALEVVNRRIASFNQRLADQDLEKKRIREIFWKRLRRDRLPAFDAFEAALAPLSGQLIAQQQEYQQANERRRIENDQLVRLRRRQVGVDAAVEAINQRLANMGIASFSIKRKPGEGSLYGLQRRGECDGELKSLSEGEKTLISFLYYMELLKGSDQEGRFVPLEKTIAIVDDPISSLSVNFVFDVASAIFTELIAPTARKRARQVIVLTHSLFFLHELLRQLGAVELNKACARSQLLRVVKSDYTQVVDMKATDLMNDYDALWWVLRVAKDGQVPAHVVPNTMRCILEHFFAFNNREEDWKKALEKLEEDDRRFRPLARFLDRGSHSDGINFSVMDYAEHDVNYYLEKLKAVFDLAGFPDHYNMRMGLAQPEAINIASSAARSVVSSPV